MVTSGLSPSFHTSISLVNSACSTKNPSSIVSAVISPGGSLTLGLSLIHISLRIFPISRDLLPSYHARAGGARLIPGTPCFLYTPGWGCRRAHPQNIEDVRQLLSNILIPEDVYKRQLPAFLHKELIRLLKTPRRVPIFLLHVFPL